ncbi:MAG: NFACT family protein, partial [Chloroflexi bacterium]|nr:NFACT family protein [Chloroflexota bacterium]
MTLAAVVDEVQATTSGGRIQRIIQPAATSVALSIYSQGDERWLLLSADARAARVHLSSRRLAKAAATPPPFVMLLRKHLEGSRVAEARQLPGERVFVLECVARGDRFRIVAEIMGKHSNVILVSQEERVLGAVKLVSPRQSRVRPVLPGQPYEPPPAQARDAALYPPGPRIDPHAEPDLFASLLAAAPRDTPLRSALLGLLAGASPFLVGQIALRAGEDGTAILGDASVDALLHASRELYGLYASREWNPSSFRDARGRPDFAPFRPRGVSNPEAEPTMSVAIERAEAADVNRDALSAARDELLAEIGRASRGAERKVASLRQG